MAVDSSITDGTDAGRLPEAVIEELLADPRRRAVILSVWRDEPLSMTQLASHVIARERSIPLDAVSTEDCRNVRENIYEQHLPKLTATKIFKYNSRQASVELDDGATQLLETLRVIDAESPDIT